MITPQELYEKTSLPLDEKLFEALISIYMEVPFKNVNLCANNLKVYREEFGDPTFNFLYKKLNVYKTLDNINYTKSKKFISDKEKLVSMVFQDYIKAMGSYDQTLYDGLPKPTSVQMGWRTFQSWNLLGTDKIRSEDQAHRFYIGVSSEHRFDFACELYKAFKQANIPFYFKMGNDSFLERPDQIVIYTSTPLLKATMEVIGNVEKKRPDLMANCHEPSIIVGKVTDKIGYASERSDAKFSYTQIICNAFTQAIESIIKEYISLPIKGLIKKYYDQQIRQLENQGISIEMEGRKQVAAKTLFQFDRDFRKRVFQAFQSELVKYDIDLNNICFNHEARRQLEAMYPPHSDKEVNDVLTLADGTKISKEDYLKKYNVSSWIPEKAKVVLKSGRVMSGREFISYMFGVASFYDNFQDLVLHQVEMTDRNANYVSAQEEQRKEIEEQFSTNVGDRRKTLEELRAEIDSQMQEETKEDLQKARELIERQLEQGLSDDIWSNSTEDDSRSMERDSLGKQM